MDCKQKGVGERMYVLNLAEDGRILSVFMKLPNGDYEGMPVVDELPDGMPTDYLYIDGRYIYSPLPVMGNPEDQPDPMERIAALEEQIEMLLSGVTSDE